jgi:hypothetical protein
LIIVTTLTKHVLSSENLAELEKDGLHDHVDALSKSRLSQQHEKAC